VQVALGVGVVAFRWDMPLSLRCAFFPILGDTVNGLVGDVIDGRRSMCARVCVFACECFCGVCKKCRHRERLDMRLTVFFLPVPMRRCYDSLYNVRSEHSTGPRCTDDPLRNSTVGLCLYHQRRRLVLQQQRRRPSQRQQHFTV